jgi:hypothetical protein
MSINYLDDMECNFVVMTKRLLFITSCWQIKIDTNINFYLLLKFSSILLNFNSNFISWSLADTQKIYFGLIIKQHTIFVCSNIFL